MHRASRAMAGAFNSSVMHDAAFVSRDGRSNRRSPSSAISTRTGRAPRPAHTGRSSAPTPLMANRTRDARIPPRRVRQVLANRVVVTCIAPRVSPSIASEIVANAKMVYSITLKKRVVGSGRTAWPRRGRKSRNNAGRESVGRAARQGSSMRPRAMRADAVFP